MEEKQVTTNDIMEFLQDNVVKKDEFSGLKEEVHDLIGFLQENMVVKEEFHGLRDQVQSIDSRVQTLDSRVQTLEVKINQVKLELIDAMDEKMGTLKGDLIVMLRTADKKFVSLVELLGDDHVMSDKSVKSILAMQPFPQVYV
ncbi:MAG: hypothetical protein WC654_01765 [Patescibacteria group bacterium]